MPGLLVQSPAWVRKEFDHGWAPMAALAKQARYLPSELWDYLLGRPGGYVSISVGESRYLPGLADFRQRQVQNVALVSVADLARDNEEPLHVLGHLVDHHLGCGGDPDGLWLSQGGGMRSHWQEAAERLPRMFALGYGLDKVAQANVKDYFAQSLAFFCRDRKRLNVADPQIYKWFHSTLWSKAFWQARQ